MVTILVQHLQEAFIGFSISNIGSSPGRVNAAARPDTDTQTGHRQSDRTLDQRRQTCGPVVRFHDVEPHCRVQPQDRHRLGGGDEVEPGYA